MTSKPSFMTRILDATSMSRVELRKFLSLTKDEMELMEKTPYGQLPAVNEDIVWSELADLVDSRIGKLMAIKFELDKKLSKDRQAKAIRLAQMRNR